MNAQDCRVIENIQSLWSGYGEIERYQLIGADQATVVIKHVILPGIKEHPRGWNSQISHERKIRSYQVEWNWYHHWSSKSETWARQPHCYGVFEKDHEILMILEDLDAKGYDLRRSSLNSTEISSCLEWLAHFHCANLGQNPDGLWEQGSYWHLATRPEELEVMADSSLKRAAHAIDEKLNHGKYKTLLHGDAKVANFCFSSTGKVAAVDFQYTGQGCAMVDLSYFLGSCLSEGQLENREESLIDEYFQHFKSALKEQNRREDLSSIEQEWRNLYSYSWADFQRFLLGWSPGHWKIHRHSQSHCSKVLKELGYED